MAHLVDDLLDVSRITSGRIELKKQTLRLADVLAHAVEMANPLIETRRQTFSLALPPGDLRVEADPDRLAQVVGQSVEQRRQVHSGGGVDLAGGGARRGHGRHPRARYGGGHRPGDAVTRF